MGQKIGFFGATQTVTGSRHLLQINGKHILVDCGLYQGSHELSERNWDGFPLPPSDVEAVVVTHAHMDHIGMLPRLVKQGFTGKIFATRATTELARVSLPDSGRLHEEEARHEAKRGGRGTPLYTEQDAYACLKRFEICPWRQFVDLPGKGKWRFLPAGHILGSAFAELYFENGERILMGGDLGRYDRPILRDPDQIDFAEYLVLESTYGDRLHPDEDPADKLERLLKEALSTGGKIIVPSFAIGRTQELLYYFSKLQERPGAPRVPIFVDSPMATSVTHIYEKASEDKDDEVQPGLKGQCHLLEPKGLVFVRDREQSKALNSQPGPLVVISGSGMANGGRVVHHLLHGLGNPDNIILFTGYQAQHTLGRKLLDGESPVQMFGLDVEVRAKVDRLSSLSAHADQNEIMRWLGAFKAPPKRTFVVHGESAAQEALRQRIVGELRWEVTVPTFGDEFTL